MLRLLISVALLGWTLPAAAKGLLEPGAPTFGEYRASCYVGGQMVEDCKGSALGAFAEHSSTTPDKVTCDFDAYWREAAKMQSAVIDVLPWQYVVADLVALPGVCSVKS